MKELIEIEQLIYAILDLVETDRAGMFDIELETRRLHYEVARRIDFERRNSAATAGV